jgi:hypothetical protein
MREQLKMYYQNLHNSDCQYASKLAIFGLR